MYVHAAILVICLGYLSSLQQVHSEDDEDVHQWSSWSRWTECSTSCDTGTKSRYRDCIGVRDGVVFRPQEPNCPGRRKTHKVCNLRPCFGGNSTVDTRVGQCAAQNTKRVAGTHFKWTPYYGGTNPCILTCLAEGFDFYYDFGPVQDGTPCWADSRSICADGHCSTVGCDGVHGSDTETDNCGVCNGQNVGCAHFMGFYMEQLPNATRNSYNKVIKIPKGARSVHVEESSMNFLALQNALGFYVINGNWVMDWPGKYSVGTAQVIYNRTKDHKETLDMEGPLPEDVQIMMIKRDKNLGVSFDYWIPEVYVPPSQLNSAHHVNRVQVIGQEPASKEEPRKSSKPRKPKPGWEDVEYDIDSHTSGVKPPADQGISDENEGHKPFDRSGNSYPKKPATPKTPLVKTTRRPRRPSSGRKSREKTRDRDDRQTTYDVDATTGAPRHEHSAEGKHHNHHGNHHGNDKAVSDGNSYVVNRAYYYKHKGKNHWTWDPESQRYIPYGSRRKQIHVKDSAEGRPGNGSKRSKKSKQNRYHSNQHTEIVRIPAGCPHCVKLKNKNEAYCRSDFVIHGKVKDYVYIGNQTRYDVIVVKNYKDTRVPLLEREYIWVDNRCRCPYMTLNREYLMMGDLASKNNELRLEMTKESFVRAFSKSKVKTFTDGKNKIKCS